jgi:hypothetical protein
MWCMSKTRLPAVRLRWQEGQSAEQALDAS